MVFNIVRKGAIIGTHSIQFAGPAQSLKVTNLTDISVKVAFITAYRYQQHGEDEWTGDRLVRSRIATNDDGTKSLVLAEQRNGALAVQGPSGNYGAPPGTMTDLSFWNRAITRGNPLIDSENGELIDIKLQPSTRERLEVLGRTVDVERFPMSGTRGRSGTLWFDAENNLVRAVVLTRGQTLTYEQAA
jgi:Family of unknown function (DUF6134)